MRGKSKGTSRLSLSLLLLYFPTCNETIASTNNKMASAIFWAVRRLSWQLTQELAAARAGAAAIPDAPPEGQFLKLLSTWQIFGTWVL